MEPTLQLRQAAEQGKLIVFAGAGVSMATTPSTPTASWLGLLEHGIQHCVERHGANGGWATSARTLIAEDELVTVATMVTRKLGGSGNGSFKAWLDEALRSLDLRQRMLVDAIAGLSAPIVTTNYDDLLCRATGLRPITWREPSRVSDFVRRTENGILHLHGHIDSPSSIVLGLSSYDDIVRDAKVQDRLKTFFTRDVVLFVGYGAGLRDPNFQALRHWIRTVLHEDSQSHFVLVKENELAAARKEFDDAGRLAPLPYGKTHHELPAYLRELAPKVGQASIRPRLATTGIDSAVREYLEAVVKLHSTTQLIGFPEKLNAPLQIEDLYVKLRASVDARRLKDERLQSAAHADAELKKHATAPEDECLLTQAFAQAWKRGRRRGVLILGDPGAGKTTHLRRLALWTAKEDAVELGLPPAIVPVYLPLREVRDPSAGLAEVIEAERARTYPDLAPGLGDALVKRGNLLVLLDGLDEIAETQDRAAVTGWIARTLESHEDSRFVVTCRYAGYRQESSEVGKPEVELPTGFLELHLRQLDPEQAADFVRKWYRNVETFVRGDSEEVREDAARQAQTLIDRLGEPDFGSGKVRELTRNPLLLTAICLVHMKKRELPRRRQALYRMCTDVLLEHWRELRLDGQHLEAEAARQVLQPVAHWMHQVDQRDRATVEELTSVVEPALARAKVSCSARTFLHAIRDRSGLLCGWSGDRLGFLHLGFQEYLTALEIRRRGYQDPSEIRLLASKLGQSWWLEVILLLLAEPEIPLFEPFMEAAMAQPGLAEQAATIDLCLAESTEFSPGPFVRLLQQAPGRDRDLWARQLLAARVLHGHAPEALAPFLDLEHPSKELDDFLRSLRGPSGVLRGSAHGRSTASGRLTATYWEEKSDCELVLIRGGKFLMGSTPKEEGRSDYEGPAHGVEVPDFYMARHPVTNEQYARFLQESPDAKEPATWGDRNYNQPRQPVVGVSWEDAKAFCKWAELELPTEAQWEYACRAGSTTRFWSGDSEKDLERVGWCEKNSGGRLHPVAEKPANPFGLFDVHGNVWECCEDVWSSDYSKSRKAHPGAYKVRGAALRVNRGGSFAAPARFARSAYRDADGPSYRYADLGFRPARRISPS